MNEIKRSIRDMTRALQAAQSALTTLRANAELIEDIIDPVDEDSKMWAIVYNVRIGEHEYGEVIRVFGTYADAEEKAVAELREWWGTNGGETNFLVFNDRGTDVTLMYEAWDELNQNVATISEIVPLTGTTAWVGGEEVLFDTIFVRRGKKNG